MAEKNISGRCEECINFEYDDEYECYVCSCDLDSDEMENFIRGNTGERPYFRPGDEYTIVRKQN